jgi:hypothetical protein
MTTVLISLDLGINISSQEQLVKSTSYEVVTHELKGLLCNLCT